MSDFIKNRIYMKYLIPLIPTLIGVFLIGIVFLIIIGAFIGEANNNAESNNESDYVSAFCGTGTVSADTDSYRKTVKDLLVENNVSESYTDLVLGQIEVEENENLGSEMYCKTDECYQKKSHRVESITKAFISNYNSAVKFALDNPVDVAIQSYSFGTEYITYLSENNLMHSTKVVNEYYTENRVGSNDYLKYVYNYISCDNVGAIAYPYKLTTYVITCDLGCYEGHKGVDLVSTTDKKIYAGGKGIVYSLNTGCSNNGYLGNTCGGGYGNYVVIMYNIKGVNYYIVYAHMEQVNSSIDVGSSVDINTFLGLEGSSGSVTGSHVHIDVRARSFTTPSLYESYNLIHEIFTPRRI
ncbi:M23 family metallopeptidase [Mollicutes bacterium LVI A0039]|nr:M23 family metallopeptidase [Mollicutes bacterium LVI A0039]